MSNKYPDVLSVVQVAEILGIGKNSAYKLVNDGIIGHKKIGRRLLIPGVCLRDYLNSARY